MKRLPIYLLIDTSGSMSGEPIAAVKNGIDMLVADLRNNPEALESAWLSVITFGGEAKQVVPLTEIDSFKCPELVAGGKTELGGALKLVCECREKECRKTTKDDNGRLRGRDWLPMVFFFTDEDPQGTGLEESIRAFKSEKWGRVVVVAANECADDTILKRIADVDQFYQANSLGPSGLGSAFRWLDETIDGEVQEPSSSLHVDIAMLFDPVYGEEYRDILRKEAEIILKTNRQIVLRVEYKGIPDYLCRDRTVGNMEEYLRAISSINSVVKISNTPLPDLPPLPPSLSTIHPQLPTHKGQITEPRLPIYLLIDTSGSMTGEPIAAVKNGIDSLVSGLRDDPDALETAWLSVITFGGEAKRVVPLTSIVEFKCPELTAGGEAKLGAALKLVCQCREREFEKAYRDEQHGWHKGDYLPLVFILSDGTVQDEDEMGSSSFKEQKWGNVVAFVAGDNPSPALARIVDEENIWTTRSLHSHSLAGSFRWVEQPITLVDSDPNPGLAKQPFQDMPPLPPDISVV